MGCDTQPLAGKAQILLGGGFDAHGIHRHPESLGQLCPHGRDVGGSFGRWQRMVASMFSMRQPCSVMISATRRASMRLSAPAYSSAVSGKCWPTVAQRRCAQPRRP